MSKRDIAMAMQKILTLVLVLGHTRAQRGSYAGKRPIGYPAITANVTNGTAGLVDRFGEDGVTTTTMRLPPEALGDRDLVDRISKLPVDKQPFWYLNWQALEANRQKPQYTDPNRPSFVNQFVEANAQTLGSRFGDDTQQTDVGSSNTQSAAPVSTTNTKNAVLRGTSGFNGGASNGVTVNARTANMMANGRPISRSSFSDSGVVQPTFTNENINRQAALVQNLGNGFRHTAADHHRYLRPSVRDKGSRTDRRRWDTETNTDIDY